MPSVYVTEDGQEKVDKAQERFKENTGFTVDKSEIIERALDNFIEEIEEHKNE